MFGFIAFLHIAGAILMWAALRTGDFKLSDGSFFGWGTAALAYTLGMRHAFDADHISAIDNTTRKLMSEGKRPLAVGFFFSLGDRKSTRLNSSHIPLSRMPSSA